MSDQALFEPIARQKTYELVAERLLALISSRRLGPGDHLPSERELVDLFHVGRSSVREALRMLETQGVISSAPNGSLRIAEFGSTLGSSLGFLITANAADYSELFETRRILEGEAAALAASRRTKTQLGSMAAAVADMETGLDSEEPFITADLRFHLLVASATRNRVLLHLMEAIRMLLHRSLSSSYHIEGSPERAIEMHRLILDAIEAGRPEEARQRMQEHVARVERDISGTER